MENLPSVSNDPMLFIVMSLMWLPFETLDSVPLGRQIRSAKQEFNSKARRCAFEELIVVMLDIIKGGLTGRSKGNILHLKCVYQAIDILDSLIL